MSDSAVASNAPVDDPLGPVHQPVVVQALEDLLDGAREAVVHGEPLAAPCHTVAQPTHLAEDLPAGLGLPLPHLLDERLPAEVVPDRPCLASSRSTTF